MAVMRNIILNRFSEADSFLLYWIVKEQIFGQMQDEWLCLHSYMWANLVSIHEQDLVDGQREQHVQEEDLIAPDDPLLLRLLV